MSTFEDRLRLAVDQCKFKSVRTCSVDQQDLADALSLIAALRAANAEQARVITALGTAPEGAEAPA